LTPKIKFKFFTLFLQNHSTEIHFMQVVAYQQAIERTILDIDFGQKPTELYDPIRYIMSLGGKRMRPVLTLLSYNLFKEDWPAALRPALGVEVFHNFTLLHDDLMDNAPSRRGKPTVHKKWNDNIAILSGDVMLVRAYELFFGIEASQLSVALQRFSTTAAEVCEGQQMDMNFESEASVSPERYLEMIKLKTSVLLGFAMELGALLSGESTENQQKMYAIGLNAGLGFQIMDDILDVYGDPIKFGKQVGGDIISNKKTLMLIEALATADAHTLTELNQWIEKTNFDPAEKVKAVTDIYNKLNIREIVQNIANAYFAKCFEQINKLTVAEEKKEALKSFFEQLLAREA
jgi:geranylgeranyl diphosphate synthase, type II